MTERTKQQCECADCVCLVTVENAIKAHDALYCSEACSNGHKDGEGCGHNCGCSGKTTH